MYKCAFQDFLRFPLSPSVESYGFVWRVSGPTIGFLTHRFFVYVTMRLGSSSGTEDMSDRTAKLAALRERQTRLLAKIEQLETQEKRQARKDDTRLKILFGAAMLADAALHGETAEFLRMVLARGITADRDRQFLKERKWL